MTCKEADSGFCDPEYLAFRAKLRKYVAAGVAYLDTDDDAYHQGIPWLWRVNLATLDLADPTHCVAGQVYGHLVDPDDYWDTGYTVLLNRDDVPDLTTLGFVIPFGNIPASIGEPEAYGILRDIWVRKIRKLRDTDTYNGDKPGVTS